MYRNTKGLILEASETATETHLGPVLAITQGAGTALAAVPANTARVLGVVGLNQAFDIYPDAAGATTG
ncbi:hypothetical protein ABZX28_25880 [Streptomyces rubiginosohelvolus]|uniref:hypothetical protein n=1 Tax=Streptomyces rubiginosohelvolus TaxID=67362 RepID=UPI0033B1FE26